MCKFKKSAIKIFVDVLMTLAILFLMSYELLGSVQHEIVGIIMFILFIIHHALNVNWAKNLTKGRQTPIRIFKNILVVLVLISLLCSMVSGVIISRHLFTFLHLKYMATASRIHMLSAYWGFIFISMHLGMHFNVFSIMIKNKHKFSNTVKIIIKILIALLFAYGVFAFCKRNIAGYLFLKNQFFILGDNEFLPFYIFDYMTVMFSIALLSHCISLILNKTIKKLP